MKITLPGGEEIEYRKFPSRIIDGKIIKGEGYGMTYGAGTEFDVYNPELDMWHN